MWVRKGLSRHQGQGSQAGFSQGALSSQEIDVKAPIHETEQSGAGGREAGPDLPGIPRLSWLPWAPPGK